MKLQKTILLPLLALLFLVGCSKSSSPETLEISSSMAGGQIKTVKIDCDEKCQSELEAVDLAPVPADAACTKIYGGPEEISLQGTINGQQISTSFNKQGGCEVARWETLASFLKAVGVSETDLFPDMTVSLSPGQGELQPLK